MAYIDEHKDRVVEGPRLGVEWISEALQGRRRDRSEQLLRRQDEATLGVCGP